MAFYRRAFLYLWRKRGKSLLLLLIFLFVNTMILSTNIILHAAEDTKADMQEKTKSKVVCEIAESGAQITAQDLEQIARLPHVISVNRFLTADSKNSAIVHADFAEKNGLAVGDEIGVEINGGKSISLTITGLYRAGNERKQDEDTLAVHRIENQVFIDNTAYTELFGEDDFYKVAVYTDAPEYLETLSEDLQTLLGDKTSMKGSDALYRQMKAPLDQITKVVELMLILTFVTGTVVISLLLCMWTRTRQKEMAVFISMGERKIKIFLQAILESVTLFLISGMASCGLGIYAAGWLQKMLVSSSSDQISLQISLQAQDMAVLLAIGGAVVLIAVFLAVFPILKTSPREILSRMEG